MEVHFSDLTSAVYGVGDLWKSNLYFNVYKDFSTDYIIIIVCSANILITR